MKPFLILTLILCGCASPAVTPPAANRAPLDDVGELRERADYPEALKSAPAWVREALTRLALRDHELNSQP